MAFIANAFAGVELLDTCVDVRKVGLSRRIIPGVASFDERPEHHSERENVSFEASFIHPAILAKVSDESTRDEQEITTSASREAA